jgi:hypothetical protein
VLSRIFGPKREEVTGVWRKLHNEELNYLYWSPTVVRVIKSRRMERAWQVARRGKWRGVYRGLVGKPEGKRPLGRPSRRCEDNIKADLQEVGCGGMDWIRAGSGQRQVTGTCECVNELSGSIKCGEFLDWLQTG